MSNAGESVLLGEILITESGNHRRVRCEVYRRWFVSWRCDFTGTISQTVLGTAILKNAGLQGWRLEG